MFETKRQLDLKNLTREEFKGIMLPDSYIFVHIDFDTQPDRDTNQTGEFRLFYGHLNTSPATLSLLGPGDMETFEQAYLFIGDHFERLDYARKFDFGPHKVGGRMSQKFETKGVLVKYDLSHIVEEVLGAGFTNIRVPYMSVNSVKLEDAEKYSIPLNRISAYFEMER